MRQPRGWAPGWIKRSALSWAASTLVACAGPGPAVVEADERPGFTLSLATVPRPTSFLPVPGGSLDGEPIAPFFLAACEVTWDEFEAWMNDGPAVDAGEVGIDAVSRPSRPYISIDRGFGRGSSPALSLSGKSAAGFAAWFSEQTGHSFRLPTERELRFAALAGRAPRAIPLSEESWHAKNSGGRTHPVASAEPNPFGLFDLYGNVAEWCVDAEGELGLFGGSYRDAPGLLVQTELLREDPAWNRSDPQLPKSTWWFADASFPGLRLATDRPPTNPTLLSPSVRAAAN